MTAGELVLVVAAVLCSLGFAALVVVLWRVLETLRSLRSEVAGLRAETGPLLDELRASTDEARTAMAVARTDLERFDRVIGSAEAISEVMSGSGRVARTAFSTPVIKAAAIASGTKRAVRRIRNQPVSRRLDVIDVVDERRRRA
jgi:Ni,Fe-hydrogenase III large subunit